MHFSHNFRFLTVHACKYKLLKHILAVSILLKTNLCHVIKIADAISCDQKIVAITPAKFALSIIS